MGIITRVAIVGGAPVAVAAVIALVAWLLLEQAERIREAAVVAGASHRNLIAATAARNDFIRAPFGQRAGHAARFDTFADAARRDLEDLARRARDAEQEEAIAQARRALGNYARRMRDFVALTTENDRLANEMLAQTARLTAITEEARLRQHTANLDIAAALDDAHDKLRASQRVVEAARDIREQLFALRPEAPAANAADAANRREIARLRLADAFLRLTALLAKEGRGRDARELTAALDAYDAAAPDDAAAIRRAAAAIDAGTFRLLKIRNTGRIAIEEELAQLIGHLADANAASHAVQNVAIRALALGRRATVTIEQGDAEAAAAVLADSASLAELVRTLPMSPLIQGDVIAAVERWREGLAQVGDGLRQQAATVEGMDRDAVTVANTASDLDRLFRQDAERVGTLLRTILAIGATVGLLLGGGSALVVARSITRPITRLQQATLRLADDPLAGGIPEVERRDELGDMARAIHFFSAELGRRERDLREAKNAADAALEELQRATDHLVQAEKLASLGQLVAGVAHEINTPLGVALTGISHLEEETRRIAADAAQGRLRKADFEMYVETAREAARMVYVNLTRAVDLIQSFKLVAVDRVSEERRRFELGAYLEEVVSSLAPSWKKAGHTVTLHREEDIEIDGLPGALAQVVSNLIVNSTVHGYAEGQHGRIDIRVGRTADGRVELVYSDDGRGIPPESRAKIFDPFFTTRRAHGSTGLGMHIVFNLVTVTLRGRIELEAAEPHGVRFIIRFPPSPPSGAPSDASPETTV